MQIRKSVPDGLAPGIRFVLGIRSKKARNYAKYCHLYANHILFQLEAWLFFLCGFSV